MRIEGKKVYLRETIEEDIKYFAEWEVRPDVTEFFTMNEGRDRDEIESEIMGRADDPHQLDLTICSLDDDGVLGRVYIGSIDRHYDSMDITRIYIGDVSKRGLGLGEDALLAVLSFGFNELGLERITLDYATGNEKAHRLYLKHGFKDEGCMRHGGKKNGSYIDLNLMSILREEYFDL